jgi:NAD(P)-dependent dehydrogenase (short-subunit alcohol dehydrogenase family)
MGAPVVHGIHIVLRALEAVAPKIESSLQPQSLSVRFTQPVTIGETVTFGVGDTTGSRYRIHASARGAQTTVIDLSLTSSARPNTTASPGDSSAATATPRDWTFTALAGATGTLQATTWLAAFDDAFPQAAAWLGAGRLRSLALLSRLVGMECPGRHSLFSAFAVDFGTDVAPGSMTWAVSSTDERFGLVRLTVDGAGLKGTVQAFALKPPVRQASLVDIRKRVAANKFKDQVALVVGGSRGLGELVAKIVAAGGGHPIITYATGETDAQGVAGEIRAAGGTCDVLRYDFQKPAEEQVRTLGRVPASLYYFASVPIFRGRPGVFNPELFREFLACYVDGFHDLCAALARRGSKDLSIFYPSSIAVVDRPRGMTEYAMAKAAGEVLCADLPTLLPGVRVVSSRLPRMATDQTASVMPAAVANALEVMLPIVREVQGRN